MSLSLFFFVAVVVVAVTRASVPVPRDGSPLFIGHGARYLRPASSALHYSEPRPASVPGFSVFFLNKLQQKKQRHQKKDAAE